MPPQKFCCIHMGLLPVKNVVNLMMQVYASWSFRHVTFHKPDFANYPEVVSFQKNSMIAKLFCGVFFNCKIVTGHEFIDFFKLITCSERARAERGFRIIAPVSCHGSMISLRFNSKLTFYMYKKYSYTFWLIK